MRILVYPHTLEIGGSQLNAVELAGAVRDLGHEVVVFGQPGPLQVRIDELALEFIEAPLPGRRPSARVLSQLRRIVRERGVEVVHGYEWTAGLETYLAAWTAPGTAAVTTVMSMAVAPFLPHDLALVVGTEQIGRHERDLGRHLVTVIEPPVDVAYNAVERMPARAALRRQFAVPDDATVLTCVTRLAAELKLEGLLAAIETVAGLPARPAVQLLIAGDGPARDLVAARAEAANAAAGRTVVRLLGELNDPRPAYAVADISLGMGGSALRALAFGTPLIVQGEQGFWQTLTPATVDTFLWSGWYGVGTGASSGSARLTDLLQPLLSDPARRSELGRFGRALAESRFSLERAAQVQCEVYQHALNRPPAAWSDHLLPRSRAAMRFAAYKSDRLTRRIRGSRSSDDFNARPVAAAGPAAHHRTEE
jgi:glycosyltransferase involved in cell wall biosynthesis